MWESLVGYLLTGLLALVGAWAGARLALSNFKVQRAFDVRLDWHRESLKVISLAIVSEKVEAEEMDPSERAGFIRVQEDVKRISVECGAFMLPQAAAKVRIAVMLQAQAMRRAREAMKALDAGQVSSTAPFVDAVMDASSQLRTAAEALIESLQELVPMDDPRGPLDQLLPKPYRARAK